MKITFLGATNTVTGSKYLLSIKGKHILVDCGLFQGYKELRLRNWRPLPFAPKDIDAVLITHAHIDHTGYLPLLVKEGFSGPIYATRATRELCSILLPDSGYLQEEDARRANKYGYSKHHPALPLYTKADALIALQQFKPVVFDKNYNITDELTVTWHRAGHILGSAFIHCHGDQRDLVFSGDMGRPQDPIMKPPAKIQTADYLVLESTYGNRLHEPSEPKIMLAKIINETVKRGGTILIPSFAVGRAQSLLYYIYQLKKDDSIPNIPVYLDSPMAVNATKIMHRNTNEHQLSPTECASVCKVAKYINTPDESRAIDKQPMPKIIISASGMASGGRVLHHLKVYMPDPKNTILFTGFQAGGTRGAAMLAGVKEIKIHGHMFPVRANIKNLLNISAHADYAEILLWLRNFTHAPRRIFITHGEPEATKSLKKHIEDQFGWDCAIPSYQDVEEL